MAISEIQGIVARIEAGVSDPDLRDILLGLCGVVQSQQEEIQRLGEVAGLPWDGQPENFCSSEAMLGPDRVIGGPLPDGENGDPAENHNEEAVDAGRIDSGHHDSSEAPYSS